MNEPCQQPDNILNNSLKRIGHPLPQKLTLPKYCKIMKKTGIELIAEERQEQIKKHGYDKEHDSNHESGELIKMAAILCCMDTDARVEDAGEFSSGENIWGLEEKLKDDEIHRLKVAGALIAAEIDRLMEPIFAVEVKKIETVFYFCPKCNKRYDSYEDAAQCCYK